MRTGTTLASIALVVALVPAAWSAERKVPSEYSTVAQAIAAAQDGDEIAIGPGEHRVSQVNVTKDLTISGAGRSATNLWGPAGNEFLRILDGARVMIRDLRVESRGKSDKEYALLLVTGGSYLDAVRIEVIGGRAGIQIGSSTTSGGRADIRSSGFRDQSQACLNVTEDGQMTIESSQVSGCGQACVAAGKEDTRLQVIESFLHDCHESGLFIYEKASARVFSARRGVTPIPRSTRSN